MNQYTPVTIYPNEDGYTVVSKSLQDGKIHETSDTFDSYDSMSEHLKEQFGE